MFAYRKRIVVTLTCVMSNMNIVQVAWISYLDFASLVFTQSMLDSCRLPRCLRAEQYLYSASIKRASIFCLQLKNV